MKHSTFDWWFFTTSSWHLKQQLSNILYTLHNILANLESNKNLALSFSEALKKASSVWGKSKSLQCYWFLTSWLQWNRIEKEVIRTGKEITKNLVRETSLPRLGEQRHPKQHFIIVEITENVPVYKFIKYSKIIIKIFIA